MPFTLLLAPLIQKAIYHQTINKSPPYFLASSDLLFLFPIFQAIDYYNLLVYQLKIYNLSSFNLILKYSFTALSKFLYVSVYFKAFCMNIKRKHPVKASSSQRNSTCPFYTTQNLYYTPFLSY